MKKNTREVVIILVTSASKSRRVSEKGHGDMCISFVMDQAYF
jgi:hypothetical protein